MMYDEIAADNEKRLRFASGVGRVTLAFLMIAALAAIILQLILASNRVTRDEIRTQSTCGFFNDVGALAPDIGANGKPDIGLVRVIADSREAFRLKACPGRQLPADPLFIQWARIYHIG